MGGRFFFGERGRKMLVLSASSHQSRRVLLCTTLVLSLFAFLKTLRVPVLEVNPGLREVVKIRPEDDFNQSVIFIGGHPRSGTTLMRAMLETHPDIRCGPETHVIPMLLIERKNWLSSPDPLGKLEEAGVAPGPLDSAVAKFILDIIVKHGPPAKYYCNKDPYVLADTKYIHDMFPNAKFLLMIRDGRALTHSIIQRNVPIIGVNTTDYREILSKWNQVIEFMYRQCVQLGKTHCLPVYYEKLVLQPVMTTKNIFKFLNITWREDVLHHEAHVGKMKLSSHEFSSEQVKKALYLDALTSWFGSVPPDVQKDIRTIAPMLEAFGYNPDDTTPRYGEPDYFVRSMIKSRG